MSAADYLMEEGRKIGLQQARQQRHQEGRQEAALAIAKNLLACGLNPDLIKQVTQLSDDKIKALSCQ